MVPMQNFFVKLARNLVGIFSKKYLLFHVCAILITAAIVSLNWDLSYFEFWQKNPFQMLFFPGVIIGGIGIALLILGLFFAAKIRKSTQILRINLAVVQATILGWLVSSLYKIFTGRGHPAAFSSTGNVINNTDFHFGFWRGGIFWGWPSGHATVALAVGVALFVLCRKNRIRYLALAIAFYVAFSVSTNIHWLSDSIAGICIGTAIGLQIGRSYLKN
ncbi:MAG: phosphatase PAP2 family protein [Patescibacteria group bacterium]